MDATVAIVDVGVCGVDALRALKSIDVGRIGVVVTDIAVREHTKAQTEAARQTEGGNGILYVGVLGILLVAVLVEVSNLKAYGGIEDEGQRVQGGIRCRVLDVHLVVLVKAIAQAAHRTVETRRLVAEKAEAKLAVGRVGLALGERQRRYPQQACSYNDFLHSLFVCE